MHHPGSVASWPLSSGGDLFIILRSWPVLSVGDLFIIPGVWKVDHCYVWAICSLSWEFGKLASVICVRFVHYPGSLASWPVLSVGDLFIIQDVWKVDHGYVWAICSLSQTSGKLTSVICGRFVHYPRSLASWILLPVGDIIVYVIINGIVCHAELNLIRYRCNERHYDVTYA
jgi:hypothetical protein